MTAELRIDLDALRRQPRRDPPADRSGPAHARRQGRRLRSRPRARSWRARGRRECGGSGRSTCAPDAWCGPSSVPTLGSSSGSSPPRPRRSVAVTADLDVGVGDAALLEDLGDRARAARASTSRSTPGFTATACGPRSGRRSSTRAAEPRAGRRHRGGRRLEPHRRGLRRGGRRGARRSSIARPAGASRRDCAPGCATWPPLRRGSQGRSSATTSCASARSPTASVRREDLARRSSASVRSPRLVAQVSHADGEIATIEIGAADGLSVDARWTPRRGHPRGPADRPRDRAVPSPSSTRGRRLRRVTRSSSSGRRAP